MCLQHPYFDLDMNDALRKRENQSYHSEMGMTLSVPCERNVSGCDSRRCGGSIIASKQIGFLQWHSAYGRLALRNEISCSFPNLLCHTSKVIASRYCGSR